MSPLLASQMALPGTDDPINVSQTVGFGIIALVMVISALRVVTTRNVVHAAMWLVVVLAGSAAQFILLAAEFVAVTQVMVYIGAVIVLFLFGVMLTRAKQGFDADLSRKNWYGGALVALAMFGLLSFALVDTFEDAKLPEDRQSALVMPADPSADPDAAVDPAVGSNTALVSDAIFADFMIPFQAVGVLLTAALIGAIAIARKE